METKVTKALWGTLAVFFGLFGVLILLSAFFNFSDEGAFGWLATVQDESAISDKTIGFADKNLSGGDSVFVAQQLEFKKLLVEKLIAEGWSAEDIDFLRLNLSDNRAVFQEKVLHINVGHVESDEQYAHHTNAESMKLCRDFWAGNGAKIDSVAKTYSVLGEVVAGILKVETNFGSWMGKHEVFNVFWSLSLGDQAEVLATIEPDSAVDEETRNSKLKRRANWARKELRQLMDISRANQMDPLDIKGSWAGAFGLAQFIPSSYNAYAKDGNADGIVDLSELDDAVASIANYLKKNGWRADGNRKRMKKVIMRYNHSEHYADCVLKLSDYMGKL